MNIILTHKHFDEQKLSEVKADMAEMGAPTIRAYWCEVYNAWLAVEGCHRLRAAEEMGLVPEIVEIETDGMVTIQDDGDDVEVDATELYAELQDGAMRSHMIEFIEIEK